MSNIKPENDSSWSIGNVDSVKVKNRAIQSPLRTSKRSTRKSYSNYSKKGPKSVFSKIGEFSGNSSTRRINQKKSSKSKARGSKFALSLTPSAIQSKRGLKMKKAKKKFKLDQKRDQEAKAIALIASKDFGRPKKKQSDPLEKMNKKLRKKILAKMLRTDEEQEMINKSLGGKGGGYSENMNDLDYLYRISYLVRAKILTLDQRKDANSNETVKALRSKLMKVNFKVNKKIRDLSLRNITQGTSELIVGQED